MKKNYFLLSLLVMITIAYGCDVSVGILVKNETSDTLSFCLWYDTLPPQPNSSVKYYLANLIPPDSQQTKSVHGSSDIFNCTFSLYVYHEDTLRKYMNMTYIDTNRLYIKKYVFNYDELEKMKNVIRIR